MKGKECWSGLAALRRLRLLYGLIAGLAMIPGARQSLANAEDIPAERQAASQGGASETTLRYVVHFYPQGAVTCQLSGAGLGRGDSGVSARERRPGQRGVGVRG